MMRIVKKPSQESRFEYTDFENEFFSVETLPEKIGEHILNNAAEIQRSAFYGIVFSQQEENLIDAEGAVKGFPVAGNRPIHVLEALLKPSLGPQTSALYSESDMNTIMTKDEFQFDTLVYVLERQAFLNK